ncbi:hypothetical protein IW140_002788 [Coemansia sp. RSA 1813]|nr:hypothetical protein EV178_005452 [Coemansia sp. RSA 1646]KAJ1770269.1 hypothetical protein LPJ74_003330 [Coemansia sp. RSA 1843]KAJ2087530.1 hypothetical protein IW138_004900 [Coemansia sp. RSA 986]KAJ2211504.1 hypothetical protein EV179_005447 [Coemansia sp. RSA 487]KAJ2569900.1 hypothetical protein IW140_002788 [Coemansia sp. RSA 1813]
MDYFEALKTSASQDPSYHAHSPVPLPKGDKVGEVINYIKHTCDDLYFTSDSDEPVEVYQLSGAGLHLLESSADKLRLPDAKDFAIFVAGSATPFDEGFVAERLPVQKFFKPLCKQQVSDRQKRLAMALENAFTVWTQTPGSEAAYYRVGFAPNIEVYVVMLIDGQVVGIKTLSVET